MILVTGATGHLGRSVVAQLEKQIAKSEFVVSTSNPDSLAQLESNGYQARLANFNDLASLQTAFKGISKLLLISTMEPNRLEQHKRVIDVAKAEGVAHIIYTGLAIQDIEQSAVKALMEIHFQTEEYLIASGLTYTILRNTMYADALQQILGSEVFEHDIHLPAGQGRVPYALRREMGEATANLLVAEGHENKTYTITSDNLYSFEEIANELSVLSGNEIKYRDADETAFAAQLQQIGFPEFLIYLHAGTIKDIKEYQYEITSTILEELLGRKPAPLAVFLRELFPVRN